MFLIRVRGIDSIMQSISYELEISSIIERWGSGDLHKVNFFFFTSNHEFVSHKLSDL